MLWVVPKVAEKVWVGGGCRIRSQAQGLLSIGVRWVVCSSCRWGWECQRIWAAREWEYYGFVLSRVLCNNYNLQICILWSSYSCCRCCCWLPLMLTRWRNESKCCTIAGRGPDLLDSAQNTEWVDQESIPLLLYLWWKAKAKAKASFVWLEILKLTSSGFTLPSFFTLLVFFFFLAAFCLHCQLALLLLLLLRRW